MSAENALLTILMEKINNDTLVLPTFPCIALKVRKAADNPDINLHVMADVIAQDPSLSARMIKIANSAFMGRSIKVNSVTQAVNRIGLRKIKNIATALAMEQLYVSKNDIIKHYMQDQWSKTISLVCHAISSMQLYLTEQKRQDLSMDTMTLAALVCNIGALPILTEAERHQNVFANPTFLDVAIQKLAGKIGAKILQVWDFDAEFIAIAEQWHNLQYLPDEVGYIDFVRLGAALSGQMGSSKDTVANLAVMRGAVSNLNYLSSDDFKQTCKNARSVFA